jgi:hypothetical protein
MFPLVLLLLRLLLPISDCCSNGFVEPSAELAISVCAFVVVIDSTDVAANIVTMELRRK